MPTSKSPIGAIALAAVLVLAGCAGSPTGATATPSPTSSVTPADGTAATDAGTVEFYLSDEKNTISDFESLTVTITKIGLHQTGDDAEETVVNETPTPTEGNSTETATPTDMNPTETVIVTQTVTTDEQTAVNETAQEQDQEQDREQDQEQDREQDDGEGWLEYEVNETADLTELQGANATKLDSLTAPNGSYDKVFIYVDGIEATLTTGEQVNVKLPSSKLHVNKAFPVGNGENVSFVFDMTVHKAGNSGKYILKPVVSESGTSEDVEIKEVDKEDGEREDEERENEDREAEEREDDAEENATESEADLSAAFVGPVEPGANATLKVTGEAGPVENATVLVDDETVGVTDASGTITFAVPEEIEELEVEFQTGEAEREVERDFTDGDSGGS